MAIYLEWVRELEGKDDCSGWVTKLTEGEHKDLNPNNFKQNNIIYLGEWWATQEG